MIEMITDYFQNIMKVKEYVKKDDMNNYDEVINGSYNVKNTQISRNLCINGQAILNKDVIVQNNMTVNGRLITQDVSFESDLTVNGTTTLNGTKLAGNAKFRGNLDAKDSELLNPIEILSDKSVFDNCKTKNLIIKELPSKNIVQRVKLINNTVIAGDIIFNSGNGEVYCDKSVKIHGKIIGGRLIG
ncbi:hypothetical protein [Legionella drozanskii]|uniref:Polymer-forming cytoskeletal n=1 Tax=Legionella drozanskii LLAP-1 TaxID=1212489 RepID=A0A0W0SX48_9GAMM|nr:hypothetical protein [Legionella drozanskii]KTC87837.1 hypothetical protein Ldro_1456 [Legionella drozanskii LLAP-1]